MGQPCFPACRCFHIASLPGRWVWGNYLTWQRDPSRFSNGFSASTANKPTKKGKTLACRAAKMTLWKQTPGLSFPILFSWFFEAQDVDFQISREVRHATAPGPKVTAQVPEVLEDWRRQRPQGGMRVEVLHQRMLTEVRSKEDPRTWALLIANRKGPSTGWNFGSKGSFSICVSFLWLSVFICCVLFIKFYSW